MKELLIRPGLNIRAFIAGDRNRLVKPIIFVIVCSLIYTIVLQAFNINDGYVQGGAGENSSINHMLNWVQNNYGYANILMSFFIAAWLRLFFRKHGFNFFEILILLCFVMGVGMLIFTSAALINASLDNFPDQIIGFAGIAYCAWAISQFYEGNKIVNIIKALIAYMMGMVSFFLMLVGIGSLYDMV